MKNPIKVFVSPANRAEYYIEQLELLRHHRDELIGMAIQFEREEKERQIKRENDVTMDFHVPKPKDVICVVENPLFSRK